MEQLISDILLVGHGVVVTIELLCGGLAIGIGLGLVLSILHYHNVGSLVIDKFVSLLRGTPLVLQLSLVYFATPSLLGIKLGVVVAGILAFGINSTAYVTEIFRAGIEAIPSGQFEAAKALKIPKFYIWKDIILPQAIRNSFPALVNEMISLLKETAVIGTISGMDLMRMAQALGADKFTYFTPLCIAAAYYYAMVLLIEHCGRLVKARGRYVKG